MTKTMTSFPLSWYCAFLQSNLVAEQSKLETVKVMGARSKINAISLNVKINKWKSIDVSGYKFPINVQNFMQKDSAQAKISSKVVGGYFFDSPCSLHCCLASRHLMFIAFRRVSTAPVWLHAGQYSKPGLTVFICLWEWLTSYNVCRSCAIFCEMNCLYLHARNFSLHSQS